MSKRAEKTYLGDGAYAEFDGFAFTVSANRGRREDDYVVLETGELGNFLRYIERRAPGLIAELTGKTT